VSADAGDVTYDPDRQYDLLTAALLGLTVGVGATLLLRRGPTGRRPISPAMMGAMRGAAWAGRGAAHAGMHGARWMRRRGGELWDAMPVEEAQERVASYLKHAKDAIDDAVESELHDLRKSIRRQRKRLGI
jgi:hypothetical protein